MATGLFVALNCSSAGCSRNFVSVPPLSSSNVSRIRIELQAKFKVLQVSDAHVIEQILEVYNADRDHFVLGNTSQISTNVNISFYNKRNVLIGGISLGPSDENVYIASSKPLLQSEFARGFAVAPLGFFGINIGSESNPKETYDTFCNVIPGGC